MWVAPAAALIAVGLAFPLQSAAAATTFGFAPKADVATGAGPEAVAAGDLNGDGKQDLVVADGEAGTVSVLLGKGDGTFEAKVDYPTGTAPSAVALVDLNGDKKPDLVLANGGSNTVSVLLGKGDGSFEPGVEYATGAQPTAVAAGDLNGDGKQDLVVADGEAGTVSVLLGKGDGTFEAKKDFATGTNPRAVAVGDLNADGKQDLAVANSGANSASALLGKGDGTFAAKQDFATGTAPAGVALADLNGDHKPDLATANATGSSASALLNTSVAAIEVSPSSLTFSGQLFGTKSAAQKVTVTNGGSAVLAISAVSVTGNFAASGCTGSSLSPGASCSISLTFTPKGYGTLKGEATIAGGAGSKVVKLAGTGLPPAPLVTTGPVAEIAGTYATLTGSVISQGPGTFYFQYGTSVSYGSVTPTLPLSSATTTQLLTSTLSLAAGTTYHYRLVATNLIGTVNGADKVFTVPPEPALLRLLRHGRLASVLQHGLRVRVSDSSPAVITLKLRVDATVARATHLISSRSKRKAKVTVGTVRVTVTANHGRNVTIRFGGAAKHNLAALGRLKLSILATVSTPNGVAGEASATKASVRR
jgi:hypothetical protein